MAKLYFYYGTMGARKTAEAIMTAYNYEEKGMYPFCISPAIDSRSGYGKWKSRIGIEREVDLVIDEETDIFEIVSMIDNIDVIIIDEAQFLSDKQVWQLAAIVDDLNIPVICYGLRTDFKGNLFPGSYRLICLADKIEEIKTMTRDGDKEVKASMNARVKNGQIVYNGEQIEIGGNDKYIAISRKMWREGRIR